MLARRMRFVLASWLLATTFCWAPSLQAAPCEEPAKIRIWWSPEAPAPGQNLRLLAVSEEASEGARLVVVRDKVDPAPLATTHRGGPPWSHAAEMAGAVAGPMRIELRQGERVLACRSLDIQPPAPRPKEPGPEAGYWKSRRAWDATTENFFSAWVEGLFDAPPAESVSFRPLTPALRDARRNFLYDHLGLREDDPANRDALPAEPDCADLPYFLRAYFAWKLGLPMGLRDCSRGTSQAPPHCGELFTNESPVEGKAGGAASKRPPSGLRRVRQFFRKLVNTAHSGSARTALADETSDFYPVELTRAALRPGAVYADPYGHVLVLVKWVPQGPGKGGLLLAVDGQPDNSVGRKRFWEGTFLFANEKSAGPGWKVFRPLIKRGEAAPAPASNATLGQPDVGAAGFARFSLEQHNLAPDEFYARMSRLINPQGLEPAVAYEEMLAALVEQLETRVGSVDNGEVYMKHQHADELDTRAVPTGFATFGGSSVTTLTFSASRNIDGFIFDPGAPAYTFNLSGGFGLHFHTDGIINNSGNAPTFNVSNSPLIFDNSSTAGNAIINLNAGTVQFLSTSTAGSAQLNAAIGTVFDFTGTTGPANNGVFSAGSISGVGTFDLGVNNRLVVGSNDLSTTVSGTISSGAITKVGSGTLTLSGSNTYAGGTTLSSGALKSETATHSAPATCRWRRAPPSRSTRWLPTPSPIIFRSRAIRSSTSARGRRKPSAGSSPIATR